MLPKDIVLSHAQTAVPILMKIGMEYQLALAVPWIIHTVFFIDG